MVPWEGHFSVVFFKKNKKKKKPSQPYSNHEKTWNKPKLKDSLQNIWPALFKTAKVMGKKKKKGKTEKLLQIEED